MYLNQLILKLIGSKLEYPSCVFQACLSWKPFDILYYSDEEWENEDLEEWEEDQEDLEIDQLQNKEEIDKNDVPFANLEDANL